MCILLIMHGAHDVHVNCKHIYIYIYRVSKDHFNIVIDNQYSVIINK